MSFDNGFFSPLDMHADSMAEASAWRALGTLCVFLLVVLVLCVLGPNIEERGAQPARVPARAIPDCPRLAPMAGRLDVVVADHVLLYQCVQAGGANGR